MKRALSLLLLLYGTAGFGQETTIRILGTYPSGLSLSASRMTQQLQAIATSWNNSGLPGASVTTVQLLNQAVAVPVIYPGLPGTNDNIAATAYLEPSIKALRDAWKTDVIVVFTDRNDFCGVTYTQWDNSNFVANTQGLDLRYRNKWYISAVNPACYVNVAPHEFGHVLGGGHFVTGGRLYSDARAWRFFVPGPFPLVFWYGTALYDPGDAPTPPVVIPLLEYSRNSAGRGDATHQNVRTLSITARSVANFYEYPNVPPVLNPPINLYGINLGCSDGVYTRHDLYWSDDPATNVPINFYEVWKSQPVGQPFIYGWTVFGPSSQSYVSGATARARVNACSGSTCSALSQTYYDANPVCNF